MGERIWKEKLVLCWLITGFEHEILSPEIPEGLGCQV